MAQNGHVVPSSERLLWGLNGLRREIASGRLWPGYQALILQVFGANRPLERETVLPSKSFGRLATFRENIADVVANP